MTVLRHSLLLGWACLALVAGSFAQALPYSPSERAKLFATCSGYLGALATSQQSIDPEEARKTEAMQDTFEVLLEAVLPDAAAYGMPVHVAHNARFDAWMHNAEMLNASASHSNSSQAARALAVVEQRARACRDLILPAG